MLTILIESAKWDADFSRHLCKEVGRLAHENPKFGVRVRKEIEGARAGTPRGQKRRWTLAAYTLLLAQYYVALAKGLNKTTAMEYSLGTFREPLEAPMSPEAMKNRFSKAHKSGVSIADVPVFAQAIALREWPPSD